MLLEFWLKDFDKLGYVDRSSLSNSYFNTARFEEHLDDLTIYFNKLNSINDEYSVTFGGLGLHLKEEGVA